MGNSAWIVGAKRTPVAPRHGALRTYELGDLGIAPALACVKEAGMAACEVDTVIAGNSLGAGGNPARHVALALGAESAGSLSIDSQCCGGLDALIIATNMIVAGQCDVILAGGVESYSMRPLRQRLRPDRSDPEYYDQAPFTPWPDRDPDMAEAADALAKKLKISRTEQDCWTVESHAKAMAARDRIASEIAPVKGSSLAHDSYSRNLSLKACSRAPPICGTVSKANASVAADAAAFCLVVSERTAHRLGCSNPVQVVSGCMAGDDPTLPGLAPVEAVRKLLPGAGVNLRDLTVSEVNEAYAVQAIACVRNIGLDPSTVNVGGGSLARGHPIGASGAIIAVRLVHELIQKGGHGLAAIAAAGGLGSAVVLKT